MPAPRFKWGGPPSPRGSPRSPRRLSGARSFEKRKSRQRSASRQHYANAETPTSVNAHTPSHAGPKLLPPNMQPRNMRALSSTHSEMADVPFDLLVEKCMHSIEKTEEMIEVAQERFYDQYPGKCAFIGSDKERQITNPCNKGRLVKRQTKSSLVEKKVFSTVFAHINQIKSENFYTWLGEFIDLILVAAIVKLADHMKTQMKYFVKKDKDVDNLLRMYYNVFVVFTIFYTCFTCHTMFWVRFTDIPGRIDDFLHLVYGIGIGLTALCIPTQSPLFQENSADGVAFGWWISLLGLFSLHLLGYHKSHSKPGVDYCKKRIVATMISASILCLTVIDWGKDFEWETGNATIFLISTLPILIVEFNGIRIVDEHAVAETEMLTERFGIFILIMLGESILALVSQSIEFPVDTYDKSGIDLFSTKAGEAIGLVVCSFIIMSCLYIVYFEGHVNMSGNHALDNAGSPGGCVWLFFHLPLGYFLVVIGTGFKFILYYYNSDSKYSKYATEYCQWQICLGLIGAIGSILIIRTAHLNFYWLVYPSTICRPFMILPLVLCSYYQFENEFRNLAIAAASMVFATLLDSWAARYEKMDWDVRINRFASVEEYLDEDSSEEKIPGNTTSDDGYSGVHIDEPANQEEIDKLRQSMLKSMNTIEMTELTPKNPAQVFVFHGSTQESQVGGAKDPDTEQKRSAEKKKRPKPKLPPRNVEELAKPDSHHRQQSAATDPTPAIHVMRKRPSNWSL